MYKWKILLFFLCLANAVDSFAQDNNWKLIKNDEGIKIYSRPALNGSPLKELKVITELKASLSAIVTVLSAKQLYPQWVYGCSSSEMLDKISDFEMYHRQVTDMPWPVQKRDLIIQTIISQEKDTKVVNVACKGVPDYRPVDEDCIRIISFKASWKLTPKTNGFTELEYLMSVDPAGSLPIWIINLMAAEGPMKTIKNLRIFLSQYKEANLSYIKN
jgi:hypothetical protein